MWFKVLSFKYGCVNGDLGEGRINILFGGYILDQLVVGMVVVILIGLKVIFQS